MKKQNFYQIYFKVLLLFWVLLLSISCEEKKVDKQPDNTLGQAMFYTSTDLKVGVITVTVEGESRTITGYNANSPACGNGPSATFDLEEGTHNFKAAGAGGGTWNGTITVLANDCSKMRLTLTGTGGNSGTGTVTNGQAIFWTKSDLGCGNISVTCNNVTKTITSYHSGGAPGCGVSGAATFDFPVGNYSYSASCNTQKWSGTVSVTSGGCYQTQLISSGTGTNPNTPTTGQAMFWLASDFKCGNVTVVCNGITRTITGYTSSGSPSCGNSSAANYTMAPGTYSFSASCSSRKWSGSVTVSTGGCFKMQLN